MTVFLDLDPERGITAGQRWVRALDEAASRCEAVLFLVSADWLASKRQVTEPAENWLDDRSHFE